MGLLLGSRTCSVQWKPPGLLVNGYISFTVPGGNEKQSRLGSATRDAVKDENSVIVTKQQAGGFAPLRQAVEAALAANSNPSATASPT